MAHKHYPEAMTISKIHEEGKYIISSSEMGEIKSFFLPAQPLGIASLKNKVVIAGYSFPAIGFGDVSLPVDGSFSLGIIWEHFVKNGVQNVRYFLNVSQMADANRMQVVLYLPNGDIMYSRNCGRKFYVISPPNPEEKLWVLNRLIHFPTEHDNVPRIVHSAIIYNDKLYTIETNFPPKKLWECVYPFKGGKIGDMIGIKPAPLYTFGFLNHPRYDQPLTITDSRSDERHGISCGDNLIIPEISGNGMCLLPDNSVLVTHYEYPRIPGGLSRIPASAF